MFCVLCWLGDLFIPVDSLSVSLSMGLSITVKNWNEIALVVVGNHSSVVRAPAARVGVRFPVAALGFFPLQLAY